MKKRLILLAPLLAAIIALGVGLRGGQTRTMVSELSFSGERDILRADLTYDAGTRTLRGKQSMTVVNRTQEAQEEIVLRLYMNAQDEGSVAVSAVYADGQAVPYALDEDDSTVLRIACGWPAGKAVTLSLTLMVRHEKSSGAALITLPQLALLENGVWRTDAYDELVDPSFAQAFDFVIRLEGDIAAQMEGARDASFALDPDAKTLNGKVSGTQVTALAGSRSTAARLLDAAQNALKDLEEIGLKYPFPSLTVVESETGREDGLALSGLIALSADGDQEAQTRRVTRLIARQTFGVLVENDPWNAPWLSYSLASAAELLCYRRREGVDAYEARFFDEVEIATRLTRPAGVTVGAGTAFFGSDAEMTQVLRDQGAAMLLGIEQAVGEEAFLAALAQYVQGNSGRIAVQADLEAALLDATGSDWSGYLADELAW